MNKYKLYFYYDYVFPNFILPNGLNKEMAIVSYIHSQYNNNGDGDAFFERDQSSTSILRQIFGEHLGNWPNSLRHGGPHFKYPCYNDLIDITEESICLGRWRHNKYIYPIKISPHMNEFLGISYGGQKVLSDGFWKNISEQALADIRNKDAILLLDWGQENTLDYTQLNRFNELIYEANLPKENVILIHNSFNLTEIYDQMFSKDQQRLTVKNWPFLFFHNSWTFDNDRKRILSIEQFSDTKNVIRKHHFLYRIRRARSYRIALLYKLVSDDLLQFGDWSMLDSSLKMENSRWMAESHRLGYDLKKIDQLYTTFPHNLESEPDSNFDSISGWGDLNSIHSKNSYFDITTETYMESNYKSFTEKVCKPLMNFQPFVFVGFHGALSLLRDIGFKTFNGFIDERYDNEPDHIKRLEMVYKEIKKLCKMSKQEIHAWYWKMEDILIHNHTTFLNFHRTDSLNKHLIEYLSKKLHD